MKLSFADIKQKLTEKPKVIKPRSHPFPYFNASEIDLSPHQLDEGLWVIKDYISKDMESLVLEFGVYNSPFNVLRDRRVQMYGGKVTPEGLVDKTQLPVWTDIFAQRLFNEKIFPFKPNHVLVNEYKSGEGIMPHTDGPAYFPLVSILSLGSDSVMEFWKDGNEVKAVYLPNRSLLLFTADYYCDMMHSIERRTCDLIFDHGCGMFLVAGKGVVRVLGAGEWFDRMDEVDLVEDVICPECNGKVLKARANYRETRISLTIRYVPIKYS